MMVAPRLEVACKPLPLLAIGTGDSWASGWGQWLELLSRVVPQLLSSLVGLLSTSEIMHLLLLRGQRLCLFSDHLLAEDMEGS